ncbi:MAG TPA: YdeI/OmpD-associated family protein [Puia sp.]|nr:YdeI/OmpD-associated family protein [Puia sp.]
MNSFSAKILKIRINPYVLIPATILKEIFKQAGKNKGPIPVCGTINKNKFTQTLVKYSGKWRLYLNTPMRKSAGIDVGDIANIEIGYDSSERITPMHPKLRSALEKNKKALEKFNAHPPYLQKEIMRYINSLKTEESIERNIKRAIAFLTVNGKFIGRN